jgi:hypothetical protein
VSDVAGRYFVDNGLHRVDIPDVSPDAPPGSFIRTEWYGNGAVFRITPVTEEAARLMAKGCTIPDAIPWDVRSQLERLAAPGEQLRLLPRDIPEDDPPDEAHYIDDQEEDDWP